jgi:hypothetical protein
MKCLICSHEMKPLFTSHYCPSCPADQPQVEVVYFPLCRGSAFNEAFDKVFPDFETARRLAYDISAFVRGARYEFFRAEVEAPVKWETTLIYGRFAQVPFSKFKRVTKVSE